MNRDECNQEPAAAAPLFDWICKRNDRAGVLRTLKPEDLARLLDELDTLPLGDVVMLVGAAAQAEVMERWRTAVRRKITMEKTQFI